MTTANRPRSSPTPTPSIFGILVVGLMVAPPLVGASDGGTGWEAPTVVGTPIANESPSHLTLVGSSNGTALAAWKLTNGSSLHQSLWFSARPWNGSWSPGAPVFPPAAGAPVGEDYEPAVALNASGHGLLVWTRNEGTLWRILASNYSDGAGLSEPVDIGGAITGPQIPHVALDDDGRAIVLWGYYGGISANRFSPSVGWLGPDVLEAGPDFRAEFDVVLHRGGAATVTWLNLTDSRAYFMQFTPTENWSAPQIVQGPSAHPTEVIHTFQGPNGLAAAGWTEHCCNNYNDTYVSWVRRISSDGAWAQPEQLDNGSLGNAGAPVVRLTSDGGAVAMWFRSSYESYSPPMNERTAIIASRFVPGRGWLPAERVANGTNHRVNFGDLALDPEGRATALWWGSDGTAVVIWSSRLPNETGWETPVQIEAGPRSGIGMGGIVAIGENRTAAAWIRSESEGSGNTLHSTNLTVRASVFAAPVPILPDPVPPVDTPVEVQPDPKPAPWSPSFGVAPVMLLAIASITAASLIAGLMFVRHRRQVVQNNRPNEIRRGDPPP